MKYFIDQEFHERMWKIPLRNHRIHIIELISIGIVAEDGREYYALGKDFSVSSAWQNEWLRENVLLPIYLEKIGGDLRNEYTFSRNTMDEVFQEYGKTNKEIAKEIQCFVADLPFGSNQHDIDYRNETYKPQFYGYYADYDWVLFCSLFGTMMDLPKGFPMYCIDLKQELDRKAETLTSFELSKLAHSDIVTHNVYSSYDSGVLKCSKSDLLKNALTYPKQTKEHNALADAKWNKELYDFIQKL